MVGVPSVRACVWFIRLGFIGVVRDELWDECLPEV